MAHNARREDEQISWLGTLPWVLIHVVALGAIFTGVTALDVFLCLFLWQLRIFFITAAYHRYFSHRTYKTSRWFQFFLAFMGGTATQQGALWWAAHHRHHHRFSDTENDVHSPKRGFWYSHAGWIFTQRWKHTDYSQVKDLAKYPELRFLNEYHWIPPIVLGTTVFLIGGWSALFFGFFFSTVLCYHTTFLVNSAAHVFGKRRFATKDTSRNSLWIALLTAGEGWHNNHHHYPGSTRQGFYWWEIDVTYYVVKLWSWLGLVWDIREPPARVLAKNRIDEGTYDIGMAFAKSFANGKRAVQESLASGKKAVQESLAGGKKAVQEGLATGRKKVQDGLESGKKAMQEGLAGGKRAMQDGLETSKAAVASTIETISEATDKRARGH